MGCQFSFSMIYRRTYRVTCWIAVVLLAIPGQLVMAQAEETAAPSGPRPTRTFPHHGYQLEGIASWYGGKFQGRLTANGEVFDTNELTAAHRELPFHTRVRVTNITNGKSVEVRINDRGPFVDDRVIDLSRAAAEAIGITATGIGPVVLEVIDYRPAPTDRIVQVASYGDLRNAEATASRLAKAGLSPEIETVSTSGVYRVVIPGVNIQDIDGTKGRLADLGFPNVLVRESSRED